jgi:uncharacterized membrane protein YfcA
LLGRHVEGSHHLLLFGFVMLAVAAAMFTPRAARGDALVRIKPAIAVRLVATGLLVGFLSSFFGIGGGFLIVPAIMLGSGMTTINAVGTSLVSVGFFGLTTAATYALAGLVDWRIAAVFVAGGIIGGLVGVKISVRLAAQCGRLTRAFATIVIAVALFAIWKSVTAGYPV